MPRYIDADSALAFPLANGKYDRKNANKRFIYGCETYKEYLEQLPTISPDEVRGVGEWEKETICYSRCSNCKKLIKTAELVEYKAPDGQGGFCVIPSIEKYDINYCPNCGAKMEVSEDA